MKRALLASLALLSPALALAVPCGTVVTSSLVLTGDMSCPNTALFVGATGVTIYLNGHSITSQNDWSYVISGPNNQMVKGTRILGPGNLFVPNRGVGVMVSNQAEVTISGVSLYGTAVGTNTSFTGIRAIPTNLMPTIKSLHVMGNTFSSAASGAGAVSVINADKLVIANNTISLPNSVGYSINLAASPTGYVSNSLVTNNVIDGGDYGVYLASGYNVQVTKNTITNIKADAIAFESLYNNLGISSSDISGNIIDTVGLAGVWLYSWSQSAGVVTNNTVESNSITNSPYYGIALGMGGPANGALVTNNLVTMNAINKTADKPIVDQGVNNNVISNTCDGNPC